MAFIQWNCRGFKTNYNELALLLQEHRPIAVCLQETNLKQSNQIRIANYSQYHCFGPANNGRACWGVSVFVRNGSPHKQITLQTELQAVAVNINAHKSITVCSIYLPPNTPVAIKQIEKLVRQLPKPYILLGDFNAHHTLWGCRDINSYGKIVDKLITQENLCILNDNSQTYLHPGTGSTSAIDLSLCDPSIYMVTHGKSMMISVAVITILYCCRVNILFLKKKINIGNYIKQTGKVSRSYVKQILQ